MKTYIYKLIDPNTLEIKYIGKSDNPDLLKRLVGHLNQIYRKEKFSDKGYWIEDLLKKSQCPIIELIEEIDKEQTKIREKHWVKFYSQNCKLYNIMYNDNPDLANHLHERKSIKIYEYNLNGDFVKEWENITIAANFYNITNGNISYAANGKRKSAGDRMWRYYKKDKINNHSKTVFRKTVHRYTLEGDYIESYDSARYIEGFKYKVISKCCTGALKTYKGFRFSFEKVDKLPPLVDLRIRQGKVKDPFGKSIVNRLGKELYEKDLAGKTRKELMSEYNISYHMIDRSINRYKKKLKDIEELKDVQELLIKEL